MSASSGSTSADDLRRLGIFSLAVGLVVLAAVLVVFAIDRTSPTSEIVLVEKLGGDTTANTATRNAFGLPARNLEVTSGAPSPWATAFFGRTG